MSTVEERLTALEAEVASLKASRTASSPAPAAGVTADDKDLDGQYGDEPIKHDPSVKYWPGESFIGSTLSKCPPEYLDAVAKYREACAYMNEKSGDASKAKYIDYDRRTAARARGWAARIRSGKVTEAKPVTKAAPPKSQDPDWVTSDLDTEDLGF